MRFRPVSQSVWPEHTEFVVLEYPLKAKAVASALVTSVLLFFGPAEAFARAAICTNLESQLRSGGGSSTRYSAAAKRQQAELRKTEAMARRGGCNGGSFRASGANCGQLNSLITRMRANLSKLENQAGSGGGVSRAQRRRILAALEQNGCNGGGARTTVVRENRGTMEQQIFGVRKSNAKRIIVRENTSGGPDTSVPSTEYAVPSGNYRTMCVRSCDGYYFPISYASSRADFDRDAVACQSMCPGTDVSLFVHSVPDQDSEDMVSLDGAPYSEMPNAFRYRTAGVGAEPQCSCNLSAVLRQPPDTELLDEPFAPTPVARPDPAADPDTQLDAIGQLTPAVIEGLTESRLVGQVIGEEGETEVRVVGPAFLPAPEAAIDLRAQDPTRIQ